MIRNLSELFVLRRGVGKVASGAACRPLHQTSKNAVMQSGRGVTAMLWIMACPEGLIW
ncbi:MAG: hypothetical protein JSV32_07950 [Dehalococcoidia bacterium]|nr:MAG: hypothetical protein JSV32_07950 [Dehalococcoidia bacterium]